MSNGGPTPSEHRMIIRAIRNIITTAINKIPTTVPRLAVHDISPKVQRELKREQQDILIDRGLYPLIYPSVRQHGADRRMASLAGFILPVFVTYEEYKWNKDRLMKTAEALKTGLERQDEDYPEFAALYEKEQEEQEELLKVIGDKW